MRTCNVHSSGSEAILLILSLLTINFLLSLLRTQINMEFFLHLYDQLQGMDHSGCGSAHESPKASYCFLVGFNEVIWQVKFWWNCFHQHLSHDSVFAWLLNFPPFSCIWYHLLIQMFVLPNNVIYIHQQARL